VRYGCVRAKFGITESGTVKDVEIVDSKPPRVFDYAVVNALPDFRFASTGTDETKVTVVSSIQFHFSEMADAGMPELARTYGISRETVYQ
jgi:TonB family protein